jgi:hypothetical protein
MSRPRLSPGHRLSELDGMTIWYETQLNEVGVEDLHSPQRPKCESYRTVRSRVRVVVRKPGQQHGQDNLRGSPQSPQLPR